MEKEKPITNKPIITDNISLNKFLEENRHLAVQNPLPLPTISMMMMIIHNKLVVNRMIKTQTIHHRTSF